MGKRPAIYLMTDEEFNAMKQKENKESVLNDLLDVSNNSKFTTKNIKRTAKPQTSELKTNSIKDDSISELSSFSSTSETREPIKLSDSDWSDMMDYIGDSPIDDITSSDMFSYRHSGKSDDKFKDLFAKETSMLNSVLADLQKRSKIVNDKIKSMSGKGTYGVSKNFSDLLEAANSLDTVKLNAIKSMADMKKSAADLKLKDKRLNPVTEVEDNDSIASAFYKQIIGGGANNFVNSSTSQFNQLQVPKGAVIASSSNSSMNNNQDTYAPFNVSQPIPQQYSYDGDDIEVDSTGYIANEKKNVEICIYKYDDGSMKFVALDEDGEVVHNYELPDESLLASIHTKPMSSYAYDEYDRKYKIIDVSSCVNLDDIDDDKYDNVSTDDKYNY